MGCHNEIVKLMHTYLDGDLIKEEETLLQDHLRTCQDCQQHFHELKRTITWIQSAERLKAPNDFTEKVMQKLPKEKKRIGYMRWFKAHPVLTAAAIFFIFMFSGLFTAWDQHGKLVVSKQENLVIQGDTVIVPHGVTVSGDLLVKNGNLRIDGTVDGNVTLIHGKLLDNKIDGEGLMASVGGVNGEFKQVDQVFGWIWYHLRDIFDKIFSLGDV